MKAETKPRAAAARQKLAIAETVLSELEANIATLALEASEGLAGAEKALAAHRLKVEAAERQASELRRAVALADRLDREAAATSAANMRAEQFAEFSKHMLTREKEMTTILEAEATIAAAYGRYSEATLAAQIAVPTGAAVPVMTVGPDGMFGPAFGPCEGLMLAELWRLAPMRADGVGRYVVPFAKPASILTSGDPTRVPAGIEEFRAANKAIITEIQNQIAKLGARELAAASATQEAA